MMSDERGGENMDAARLGRGVDCGALSAVQQAEASWCHTKVTARQDAVIKVNVVNNRRYGHKFEGQRHTGQLWRLNTDGISHR
jgi:hypothetical protein